MIHVTTALGRLVPEYEAGTVFQDLVLKVLFDFRMSRFNSNNVPMPLSALAKATRADPREVKAIADSLVEGSQPLLERMSFQGEDAYRMTGRGVVFVQNVPQGLASVM